MSTERICLDDLQKLGPQEVRTVNLPPGPPGAPRQALVVRDGAGALRAYANRCQHLPVPIDAGSGDFWSQDRRHLECKTHGALFQLEDGLCIAGPCAGDYLEPLTLEERDGNIYLLVDGR